MIEHRVSNCILMEHRVSNCISICFLKLILKSILESILNMEVNLEYAIIWNRFYAIHACLLTVMFLMLVFLVLVLVVELGKFLLVHLVGFSCIQNEIG